MEKKAGRWAPYQSTLTRYKETIKLVQCSKALILTSRFHVMFWLDRPSIPSLPFLTQQDRDLLDSEDTSGVSLPEFLDIDRQLESQVPSNVANDKKRPLGKAKDNPCKFDK